MFSRWWVVEQGTGRRIEWHTTEAAARHAVEVLNAHEAQNNRPTRYEVTHA